MYYDWFLEVGEHLYSQWENEKKSFTDPKKEFLMVDDLLGFIVLKAKIDESIQGSNDSDDSKVSDIKKIAMETSNPNIKSLNKIFKKIYNNHSLQVNRYPKPTCLFQTNFCLKTPYISRDDQELSFVESPITKDKVYGVPMIKASSWKGLLRHACFQSFWRNHNIDLLGLNEMTLEEIRSIPSEFINNHRLQMIKLFGNETDSMETIWDAIYNDLGLDNMNFHKKKMDLTGDAAGLRGRLYFYSTFFTQDNSIKYVVINPIDRMKRTSKRGPIHIQAVSDGLTGDLQILYFPYDLILKWGREPQTCIDEVDKDIQLIEQGLTDLFHIYGISAKGKADYGQCQSVKIAISSNFQVEGESYKSYSVQETE